MKKIITLVTILAVIFGLFKLLSTKPNTLGSQTYDSPDLVLFWGDGCPHCEKVKEYIQTNKLDSKVKINYKEVYYNKSNQKLLSDTVKQCPEIDSTQGIGVPLAFDPQNKQCLYGDQPIIDWLKTK